MKPQSVTDLEMSFPARIEHLMPPYSEIPQEFKDGHTKWNNLFSDWFFSGLSSLSITPKEGIKLEDARRHLHCVMGSFEPKHEHKEAACAYLMSLWFEDAKWEKKKQTP